MEIVAKLDPQNLDLLSLKKKMMLVSANMWIKVGDNEKATEVIEKCCQLIKKGEREELKVYFLAFKMHAAAGDK